VNLARLLERYPRMKEVLEECLRMKMAGSPYSDIRIYFMKLASELYPSEHIKPISRTTLWRLEELRKEQVLEHQVGLEKCHACERFFPPFELEQTWVYKPDGQPFDCGRLCGECRHKAKMIALGFMDEHGKLINRQHKELDLGDFIYVKRNPKRITSSNPRGDRDED